MIFIKSGLEITQYSSTVIYGIAWLSYDIVRYKSTKSHWISDECRHGILCRAVCFKTFTHMCEYIRTYNVCVNIFVHMYEYIHIYRNVLTHMYEYIRTYVWKFWNRRHGIRPTVVRYSKEIQLYCRFNTVRQYLLSSSILSSTVFLWEGIIKHTL